MEFFQNNKFLKIFIAVLIIFFILFSFSTVYLYLQNQQLKNQITVTNFDECSLVKGATIQYSYPATCVMPSGEKFVQELTDEEMNSLVSPEDNSQSGKGEETNNIVKCGGWDSSGEIICECKGNLIKPECPQDRACDSGDYLCQGECGSCCYKGAFDNPAYPKCQ